MPKQFEHQLYEGIFDARSVTLQLKRDPNVRWSTQLVSVCYVQEASDPYKLFEPFLTVPECLLLPLFLCK